LKTWIIIVSSLTLLAPTLDLDKAQQLARESEKPILIDFYATWCAPCRVFDRESQSDAELRTALDRVVLVKVDAESEQGEPLARKFAVRGYPTYALVDSELRPFHSWSGYEKQFFIRSLQEALDDMRPFAERERAVVEQLENDPSIQNLNAAAEFYATNNDFQRAIALLEQMRAKDPGAFGPHLPKLFELQFNAYQADLLKDPVGEMAQTLELMASNRKIDAAVIGKNAYLLAKVSHQLDNTQHLATTLRHGIDALKESGSLSELHLLHRLSVLDALWVKGDVPRAVSMQKTRYPEGWEEDTVFLNQFAWWCFENKCNLTEARQLAERGAELAQSNRDKAMILDTLAEIVNLGGDPGTAAAIMRRAMAADPDSDYYPKQLKRFESAMEDAADPTM